MQTVSFEVAEGKEPQPEGATAKDVLDVVEPAKVELMMDVANGFAAGTTERMVVHAALGDFDGRDSRKDVETVLGTHERHGQDDGEEKNSEAEIHPGHGCRHQLGEVFIYEDHIQVDAQVDDGRHCNVEGQQVEELEVEVAHTVRDPRTVMVHLQHALVAHVAMMCSVWLPTFAHFALHDLVLIAWSYL